MTTTPLQEADYRRRRATAVLESARREDLGQFLTPPDVARFMAGLFGPLPDELTLLDAGAGTGSLTAAFVEEAYRRPRSPKCIRSVAFEMEGILAAHLVDTLKRCQEQCAAAGIEFTYEVHAEDFIRAAVTALKSDLFASQNLSFDAAILNPPYRKIGTDSRERRLLQQAGCDATNLYAGFVALAIGLLKPGAQLVVIMPRSFCNGPYFRPFRDVLLSQTSIVRIHLFDSRTNAFRDDGVLQENLILHLVKGKQGQDIVVSSSSHAGAPVQERTLAWRDVVREANGDRFIHLPTEVEDDAISSWMASLPSTLAKLGLVVSTGRVVDFRAKEWLRQDPEAGAAPLIYPGHLDEGLVRWPKSGKKPNAIVDSEGSRSLLVPTGYYTLTKRFTSKEERRRVVAAVCEPGLVPGPWIGFENHLNYFHREGSPLERNVAFGLAVFLNSTPVDRYFRQFNGHTQVNATDLRSLRYPCMDALKEFGAAWLSAKHRDQEDVDRLVLARFPLGKAAA